jgi:hypothetical protein
MTTVPEKHLTGVPDATTDSRSLEELISRFDNLVAKMQTPEAQSAADALFNATPKELGEAAVRAAQKK